MPATPMFPLGTVLLPGMPVPLHVFEPRYRQLVDDCQSGDGTFGVVLIERGSEVGGGDVRTDVGTLARIVEARELPDGRWLLGVVGVERIRVERWLEDDPYPRAEVAPWPDRLDGPPSAGESEETAEAEPPGNAVMPIRGAEPTDGSDAARSTAPGTNGSAGPTGERELPTDVTAPPEAESTDPDLPAADATQPVEPGEPSKPGTSGEPSDSADAEETAETAAEGEGNTGEPGELVISRSWRSADRAAAVKLLRRTTALLSELGRPAPPLQLSLPDDPVLASYVAVAVSPLGPADRQRLLVAPSVPARWKLLRELLADQVELLHAQLTSGPST